MKRSYELRAASYEQLGRGRACGICDFAKAQSPKPRAQAEHENEM